MKFSGFLFMFLYLNISNSYCQTGSFNGHQNKINDQDIVQQVIYAGQHTGCGIKYTDVLPDDNTLSYYDPWNGINMSKNFDFDGDGINDFSFTHYATSVSMLGYSENSLSVTSLNDNAICVSAGNLGWADSLRLNDVIDSNRVWSTYGLIHAYSWSMSGNSYSGGFWGVYYLGIKIKNGNKVKYGWVDVDASGLLKQFAILDSCIVQVVDTGTVVVDTGTVVVDTSTTTIDSNSVDLNLFNIYPNPFSSTTTISTNGEFEKFKLTVYNIVGEIVRQETIANKNFLFSRRGLPGGLYYLTLSHNKDVFRKGKFIITDDR